MSAHFILRYRGQPVRFTEKLGRAVWSIVPVDLATPFSSEADAYTAALANPTLRQQAEWLAVENRHQRGAA